ncbi:MAG: DinB family protein [Acidobacteriota bacterium]
MEFRTDAAIEILSHTPATLNAILRDVPGEWLMCDEGEGTWRAYDVIGHLIHGEEANWIVRAKIILDHGTARPFDPYDRFAQFERSKGKTANQLLDTFEGLRRKNLEELERIATADKLSLRGTHPSLGEVTLSQLLAAWVVHDLDHIGQIVRVMSKQYTEAVGPWKAYLSILSFKGIT